MREVPATCEYIEKVDKGPHSMKYCIAPPKFAVEVEGLAPLFCCTVHTNKMRVALAYFDVVVRKIQDLIAA